MVLFYPAQPVRSHPALVDMKGPLARAQSARKGDSASEMPRPGLSLRGSLEVWLCPGAPGWLITEGG